MAAIAEAALPAATAAPAAAAAAATTTATAAAVTADTAGVAAVATGAEYEAAAVAYYGAAAEAEAEAEEAEEAEAAEAVGAVEAVEAAAEAVEAEAEDEELLPQWAEAQLPFVCTLTLLLEWAQACSTDPDADAYRVYVHTLMYAYILCLHSACSRTYMPCISTLHAYMNAGGELPWRLPCGRATLCAARARNAGAHIRATQRTQCMQAT
jgi:hypothetical protein